MRHARNLPDEEKPARNVGLDYVDEGQLKVREQDEWIWERALGALRADGAERV